jgi:hypothetical protein
MKLTEITNRSRSFCTFLNENNLTDLGVEVGVREAKNANRLLTYWQGQKLFLIDTWRKPETKKAAIQNIKHHIPRYTLIHNTSLRAVTEFKDNTLDFCHIDAGHTYKDVLQDMYAWYPKIKPGGVLCGHDYSIDKEQERLRKKPWPHIGVQKAVDEFVKEKKLFLHTDQWEKNGPNCWYITK